MTVLGVALLLLLHGFAAHLRDATAVVGEENALSIAIDKLTTRPWQLQDLTSFYLFGLGVLFAIAGLWKGYTFDDPYPGYGAVFRRADDARQNYSDVHLDLFDDLKDHKEETIDALIAGIKRIPIYFQKADQIRSARQSLSESLRNYEPSIESAGNQLLQTYRDANRASRRTPAPEYFGQVWHLPYKYSTTMEYIEVTSDIGGVSRAELDLILSELRPQSDALLEQYATLLERYPHPTNMT